MSDSDVLSSGALERTDKVLSASATSRENLALRDVSEETQPRAVAASKPPRLPRSCCLLASGFFMELLGTGGVIDPNRLGSHNLRDEKVGLLYTSRAGFLDIGHVRDLADQTNWIYEQIVSTVRATGTMPGKVQSLHGFAQLRGSISPQNWIDLAGSISYLDGVTYEIFTYDRFKPGMHSSAFSPEDLPSNFLGIRAAMKALEAGSVFDRAFEATLAGLLGGLGVMPRNEAMRAFSNIEKRWIAPNAAYSNEYLVRRNLKGNIWQAGHPSDDVPVDWILPVSRFSQYNVWFDFTFDDSGTKIRQSEIGDELRRIASDAIRRYGSNALEP